MSLCKHISNAFLRHFVGEVLEQFNPQHLFGISLVLSGISPFKILYFGYVILFLYAFLCSVLTILTSTIYVYTEKLLPLQANCYYNYAVGKCWLLSEMHVCMYFLQTLNLISISHETIASIHTYTAFLFFFIFTNTFICMRFT